MTIEDTLRDARAKLAAGDPHGAYDALEPLVGYPAPELEDARTFSEAFRLVAEATRAFGAGPLADAIAAVGADPGAVEALYAAAYGLYEERQFAVAATLLARADRLAPGQPDTVTELSACLEALLRNGDAAAVVDDSGLVERDPFCAYLSGFNWLMAGDLATARARLALVPGGGDAQLGALRAALAGMLARADALVSAGVALDARALTAWHAVLNGALLLHESPHGYDEPMRGRYAYVGDSPGLQREGLERLAGVLASSGRRVERVIAAPDRPSRILARAAAARLDLPYEPWGPGGDVRGLVVAWSLDTQLDVAFLKSMREVAPDQVLFVHASAWVDPFPFAPDVTTLLHQSVTHPWTGGAVVVDPATRQLTRAEPDPRDEATLAEAILAAEVTDPSASPMATVLAVERALASLPERDRLGLHRASGPRLRQRAGGPVPSARFR